MLSSLQDCVMWGSSLLWLRMNVDIMLWLCLARLFTVMTEDECWHSVMTVSCQALHCYDWGWMLTLCYDCVMWGSSLLWLRMNVDILLWLVIFKLLVSVVSWFISCSHFSACFLQINRHSRLLCCELHYLQLCYWDSDKSDNSLTRFNVLTFNRCQHSVCAVCVVIDKVQDQLESSQPGPLVEEVVSVCSHW